MDRAQHSVPAGSRGYLNESTQDAYNSAAEGAVVIFVFGTLHGPVDHYGSAHDGLASYKAPVPAVPAMVSIVSHGEIVSGRHHEFSILDVLENLIGPLRLHAGNYVIVASRREIVEEGVIGSGGVMIGIGFSEPLAIAINLLVNDFDPIARHSDNTLHVMRMILERKFEYDNVPAFDVGVRQKMLADRPRGAKASLSTSR